MIRTVSNSALANFAGNISEKITVEMFIKISGLLRFPKTAKEVNRENFLDEMSAMKHTSHV